MGVLLIIAFDALERAGAVGAMSLRRSWPCSEWQQHYAFGRIVLKLGIVCEAESECPSCSRRHVHENVSILTETKFFGVRLPILIGDAESVWHNIWDFYEFAGLGGKMTITKTLSAAGTALALSVGAAQAVSVSITEYNQTTFAAFQSSLGSMRTEGFENLGAGGTTTVEGEITPWTELETAAGFFSGIAGPGSGSSVIGTGTNVALKEDDGGSNLFGRSNTTVGGSYFLDSNDMGGLQWDVRDRGMFDTVAFTLSDAVDVGATLKIKVNGAFVETIVGKSLSDGDIRSVVISFGEKVSNVSLQLLNFTSPDSGTIRLNDGFGIDDATIGNVVPLPAAGWLLLGGLGGLAAMKRRRKS